MHRYSVVRGRDSFESVKRFVQVKIEYYIGSINGNEIELYSFYDRLMHRLMFPMNMNVTDKMNGVVKFLGFILQAI